MAGLAFAMNDRLSFSTAVSGVFDARTELAGGVLPADEDYSLRFALTSLLAERLYSSRSCPSA